MTLRASLLRELESPGLSVDRRAELACELAKQLEDCGEYEEARKLLAPYWRRIGERPKLTGLEPNTAAEVLLRAGVLTGLIGDKNQIPDVQEAAKNLISESLVIFQTRRYRKKIAEAQSELALCYWRTGEVNEARDLLEDALSRLTVDNELKGRVVQRLAIVQIEASCHDKALQLLTDHAPLFHRINNQTIRGCYHITLGNVLEKFWEEQRAEYLDRALVEYSAASYHFEQAGHRCYLANVENNLGLLYFTIKRYDEAHEHLNHARRVLTSLKETATVAQVDETRACVFLKQGRVTEAERAARSSINVLENSGRQALLAEALITHGRALARLGEYSAALAAFRRAIDVAQSAGCLSRSAAAALGAFQEMGDHLAAVEGRKLVSGRGLIEEIRSFEHDVIKRALENAQGSVTHAARSLGLSYQALSYMLQTRHKDLLERRTPVRRRPRN